MAEQRVVTMHDARTGVDEDMEVVVEVERDEHEYGLLTPLEPTLYVVRLSGGGPEELRIEDVDGVETLRALEAGVNALLAPHGARATLRGGRLTLAGELPDAVYEQAEEVAVQTGGEPEAFAKIGELGAGNGVVYWLLLPLEEELMPAELLGDEARPLEEDEVEPLMDLFQAALDELDEDPGTT